MPANKRSVISFLVLKTVANFFILSGFVYLVWAFYPIVSLEIAYLWKQAVLADTTTQVVEPTPEITPHPTPQKPPPPALSVVPVNTQNAIIIEKIDVNTPIIFDVSVTDKDQYFRALEDGVAHANGTALPGARPGNTYLFAHSTPNPLEIKKYGAVFTLLNKLEPRDRITIFADHVRYDYLVTEIKVVKSFDLSPLIDPVTVPTLTLQTCDPPGVPINRLIVRAELEEFYELAEDSSASNSDLL